MADDVVRAMMALRINDFCRGNSGLRLETIEKLAQLLNTGIIPVVPEKGSVGASGDLVPMAHLSLVLIGEGEAFVDGVRMTGAKALAKKSIPPLELAAGEGLALINGTQFMIALGCLALHDALNLCKHADIAASMSLETLMGTRAAFDPRIHRARPHTGQMKAARALGMSDTKAIVFIILPQALRLSIPGWTNEYAILLKDSAVTYALGVTELMSRAHHIASRTYEHLAIYLAAGFIFLIFTYIGTKLLNLLHKKVSISG